MTNFRYQDTALWGVSLCLLAVAIGAFGSHALKDILIANQREAVFDLANRYQFYHGLALLALAALFQSIGNEHNITLITVLMTSGVVIFSASLYCLALTNIRWLGAIAPIGGSLMIIAWLVLAWRLFKKT